MKQVLIFLLTIASLFEVHAQSSQRVLIPGGRHPRVGQWEKLEIGILPSKEILEQIDLFLRNNQEGLNPFAEEDLKIQCRFSSEKGSTRTIDAFYYKQFRADYARNRWMQEHETHPFLIRFAPWEKGKWTAETTVFIKGEKIETLEKWEFDVMESGKKGRLVVPEKNAANPFVLLTESDGKSFYAIGENITHANYLAIDPVSHERHKRWLNQLADNGGNFVRLEYGAQNFLIDWLNLNDYSGRLDRAWAMDELVDLCVERGLYFILFNHHVEYELQHVDPHWKDRPVQWLNNPFRALKGISNVDDVFTSEEAWKFFKRRFRYLFSRYGWAPHFAIWEFSELDNIYGKNENGENRYHTSKKNRDDFKRFFVRLKNYIQTDLGYSDKMIAVSFANNPKTSGSDNIYSVCDLSFIHKYGERKDENFVMRHRMTTNLRDQFKKPTLMEEMGPRDANMYCCTGAQFHHDIWSTAFMGAFGCGMHWWWDRGIHDKDYHEGYKALAVFFEGEDLSKKQLRPRKMSDKNGSSSNARSKRKWECYYLSDSRGDVFYGWILNSTSFWANEESACMKELKEKNFLNQPCKMEDGAQLACPPPCAAFIEYKSDDFKDHYNQILNIENLEIEIPGARSSSLFGKKEGYRLEWYSTSGKGGLIASEIIESGPSGKLRIKVLPMGTGQRGNDYAFKIRRIAS